MEEVAHEEKCAYCSPRREEGGMCGLSILPPPLPSSPVAPQWLVLL